VIQFVQIRNGSQRSVAFAAQAAFGAQDLSAVIEPLRVKSLDSRSIK